MRSGWKTGPRNGVRCGSTPASTNSSTPTSRFAYQNFHLYNNLLTDFNVPVFFFFLEFLIFVCFYLQARKEFVDLFQNQLKGKLVKTSKWKLLRKSVVKFRFRNKLLIVGNKWCHCSWKRFAWKLISLYRDKNANWNHEKTAGKNWGF